MPILFSHLLTDPAFAIKNRRDIKTFYDQVKSDVKANKLTLEGHTLPLGMNDFIRLVEGDKKLPARDSDVVDFSLAEDKKYASWRSSYLAEQNPVYLSAQAKDLLQSVQELDTASSSSMSLMNGTKDDVVAALSDLQAAVYMFMTSYDKVQKGLGLPERTTALERVKLKKATARKTSSPKSVGDTPSSSKTASKKATPKRTKAAAQAGVQLD